MQQRRAQPIRRDLGDEQRHPHRDGQGDGHRDEGDQDGSEEHCRDTELAAVRLPFGSREEGGASLDERLRGRDGEEQTNGHHDRQHDQSTDRCTTEEDPVATTTTTRERTQLRGRGEDVSDVSDVVDGGGHCSSPGTAADGLGGGSCFTSNDTSV